ncbi:hypothetical protein BK819_01065 [Microbacterium sp. LCT-H2]|nr:hypothetical protein BK819_01065 [Microbacterium sp. LCT-H2]
MIQTGPFGSQLHASDYQSMGTPVVMPTNLGDNVIREAGIARIGDHDVRRLARHKLREGDVIFSRRGDVGRRSIVRAENSGWLCGTGCLAVKFGPNRADVNPKYVSLLIGTPRVQTWLFDNAVGGTMLNLNTSILSALPLSLPHRNEQDAAVKALEGAFAQESALERLIAKKRDIKQGLMQELLTGRTRLPGFTSDWTTLKVASVSHLKARIGWQGLTTEEYRASGTHRLVGGTDFADGRINWNTTPYVDKWRYDQDPNIQLRAGDVLITKDGTIGKIALIDRLPGPTTLNSGVFVLRPKQGAYDSALLFCMLRSRAFDEFVAGLSAGSTINHLYQKDLVTLEFRVPVRIEEQAAIAAVILDVDAELAALDRRLVSARNIKQGMMQELLSGRTRLVPEVAA